MRILHIINSMSIGGAERLIAEILPLMKKTGADVELYLLSGVDTQFKKQVEEHNIKIHEAKDGLNIYSPLHLFSLFKIINKYDIVHAHLFPALYWVALAYFFTGGKTKLVYTEHSTENKRRGKLFFKLVERSIYLNYKKIIAISESCADNLKKHIGDSKRIITINNGVNLENFNIKYSELHKADLGINKDSCIIAQVASFRMQKDQDTVIRALSLLPKKFHILFVGDGERRQVCKDLAAGLGVGSRVHFLGIRTDIPDILQLADIVVMSSHYEGFGLAALEGMASKKPTIASDVPGLRDVVKGAGLLFDAGDFKSLSQIILDLNQNKEYYDQITEACLARSKEFSIEVMVDRYIDLYHNVLKK